MNYGTRLHAWILHGGRETFVHVLAGAREVAGTLNAELLSFGCVSGAFLGFSFSGHGVAGLLSIRRRTVGDA